MNTLIARSLAWSFVPFFGIICVHCGATTNTSEPATTTLPDGAVVPINPPVKGVEPKSHRVTAAACEATRGPGLKDPSAPYDSGVPGRCSSDADCTEGKNGRCLSSRIGYSCSYDACTTDADCPTDSVCDCGTPSSNPSVARGANRCLKSNCHVDSDCGAGGYCSPSFDPSCGNYSGIVGYFCRTAKDTCVNDSDCTDGGDGYCAWQETVARWQCSYSHCVG